VKKYNSSHIEIDADADELCAAPLGTLKFGSIGRSSVVTSWLHISDMAAWHYRAQEERQPPSSTSCTPMRKALLRGNKGTIVGAVETNNARGYNPATRTT
jgi:hypothetical protein